MKYSSGRQKFRALGTGQTLECSKLVQDKRQQVLAALCRVACAASWCALELIFLEILMYSVGAWSVDVCIDHI